MSVICDVWPDVHVLFPFSAPRHVTQAVAKSGHVKRKLAKRQADRVLDPLLDEQVASGRFIACISSRPGQVKIIHVPKKIVDGWCPVLSLFRVKCVPDHVLWCVCMCVCVYRAVVSPCLSVEYNVL